MKNGGNTLKRRKLMMSYLRINSIMKNPSLCDGYGYRTVYIPVTEIESMELGKNATSKHGTVIVHIKERSKPLVTNDIVEPQKLIDIFNNLETFVESPYGK